MPRRPNDEVFTNLHLRLPSEDYARVQRACEERTLSVNRLCTRAIEWYLDHLEQQEPLP